MLQVDIDLVKEALQESTIEVCPVYGELRIYTNKHKVYINGIEATVASYLDDGWYYETFYNITY